MNEHFFAPSLAAHPTYAGSSPTFPNSNSLGCSAQQLGPAAQPAPHTLAQLSRFSPGAKTRRSFTTTVRQWALAVSSALACSACLPTTSAPAAELHAVHAAALNSIRRVDVQDSVAVLADDAFEGREAGSAGGRAAAGFIVQRLQKLGIAGALAGGSYRQPFGNQCQNLLAIIPGKPAAGDDPQLPEQVILLSAHYDHVGYGSQRNSFGPFGYVHNGADDNASGVATLLEIAEAISLSGYQPRHTLLLAFWDGEEQGLLGSKHWCNQPTISLEKVRLMINLDMVGRLRDNRVELYGTRSWDGAREIVARANSSTNLALDCLWEHKDNSDHDSFFQRSIPYLMFHTGLHENYHRPSDDVQHLNYDGVERVTKLVWNTLLEVDQRADLPGFRPAARTESEAERRRWEMAVDPAPRLGITWDASALNQPTDGLLVTAVTGGWPAAEAGIRPGHRIVACNGAPITSETDFQAHVFAAETLTLTLAHGPAPSSRPAGAPNPRSASTNNVQLATAEVAPAALRQDVIVRLPPPQKLGFSWRDVPGEPQVVTLVQVVPGSPAARAGLAVGDRLIRLAHERFQDSTELSELARRATLPATAEIERLGQIRQVLLEPWPANNDATQ